MYVVVGLGFRVQGEDSGFPLSPPVVHGGMKCWGLGFGAEGLGLSLGLLLPWSGFGGAGSRTRSADADKGECSEDGGR